MASIMQAAAAASPPTRVHLPFLEKKREVRMFFLDIANSFLKILFDLLYKC